MHREYWYYNTQILVLSISERFWDDVESHLQKIGIIQNISVLNKATITLGYLEAPIVNHVIVVGKRMIANKYFFVNGYFVQHVKERYANRQIYCK